MAFPYKKPVSCAGRKKIRGGRVALAEADRIFLERPWRPRQNFLGVLSS